MSGSEVRALVSLLDDRDPEIVRTCVRRLQQEGAGALPALDEAAVSGKERGRLVARSVARRIREAEADRALVRFAGPAQQAVDLEEGTFLLARTSNPRLDVERYRGRLDRMAADLDAPEARSGDPVVIARLLRRTLGLRHGLRGDRRNFFDPQNSFVDRVLDRGLGIPISLSAVYLFVARRRGIPLHGVGMPGHFIVQCGDDGEALLDPFDGGSRIRRSDCLAFLEREGYGACESFLRVTPDRLILARMIVNLVHSYRRLGKRSQARRYGALFEQVADEPAPL
ncbi:MAG: hypothetical protein HY812_13975 [Planctomycetes bacterium]|nr:hypothetical protein [Planctomycetota bacterium]